MSASSSTTRTWPSGDGVIWKQPFLSQAAAVGPPAPCSLANGLANSPIRVIRREPISGIRCLPAREQRRIPENKRSTDHEGTSGSSRRARGHSLRLQRDAAMSPVISAKLSGKSEAPKKGEEEGSGLAVIHLNAAKGSACWQFKNVKGSRSRRPPTSTRPRRARRGRLSSRSAAPTRRRAARPPRRASSRRSRQSRAPIT